MKPITFDCQATLSIASHEIAERILDTSNWNDFQGYGLLPGIKAAEFEVRTPEIVGSRIHVENTDGSSHVEEIVEGEPERRLRLHMAEVSAPLSWLATSFDETWEFERVGSRTSVVRSFELPARSALTRPFVWLISLLLKGAIEQQLRQMSE